MSDALWSYRLFLNDWLDSALDDGHKARNNLDNLTKDRLTVLLDIYQARYWDLLHGGGVYTLDHHDAGGFLTFLRIIFGFKFWGIIRPTGWGDAKTREALIEMHELFIRESWEKGLPESWQLRWEALGGQLYAIPVAPGDLM